MPEAGEKMIKQRNDITIFRYDDETGKWDSFILKNALIHSCRGIHESLRGIKYNGQTIIRVKIKNPQDIYCGDKVVIGKHMGVCPSDAMTVVSITDNNKGTSFIRHMKIICEG